ncbi:MAG: alpha-amylase family glycosyl hydrolase [Chloroflexi bacterium]|nr:alpha-amylase family glycosyl hydrolase [Chloroflexota bacterium]
MRHPVRPFRAATLVAMLALVAGILPAPGPLAAIAPDAALAAQPQPGFVTLVGSLQSEAGCAGDWDPTCAATLLTYDAADEVWQKTLTLPAGDYEYKVALEKSWDVNYGANAQQNGANIPLNLGATTTVKFYYSHGTHWITDSKNSIIATAPGNYQSEIGCPGDWQPDCLRSWLQDPDGDGIYAFTTRPIPGGTYEVKVALDEKWDVSYGEGGVQNGPNISFSLSVRSTVTFSWDSTSHVLSVSSAAAGSSADDNVEWDGLRHDSRDTLYRTPGGAVPEGTPVTLRLRTFHDDVTGAKVRFYSVDKAGQQIVPMTLAASGVSCYEPSLEADRCDFWQLTLPGDWGTDNLWYRFIVTDGSDTDYYADNTTALDGGPGAASDDPVDTSYALMVYDPAFAAPAWAKDAVIYQIFPDRFANGRSNNDARTGDVRYDDPVLRLPWGTLPEGYCRNYADGATNCPWRFDDSPPADSPTKESPRGRDYMGGDLMGVTQQLNYLQALGVTTVYFNPIFDAGSNHSYDTQDYTTIDPYFGTQQDWENLVKLAGRRGIRIVLDGVFNHLSSDSPFFDRYGHYAAVGACESAASEWRSWFSFRDVPAGTGTCVSSTGVAKGATYDGWFGFDSIPVINKAATTPGVWDYFLTGSDAIATRWLEAGAAGWRMDVSGDASFPSGYWETFREVVKATRPDALTISETWQKDSTLLRMLRGDRFDTTMNYRLRDAVLGFLAPGPFDSKGFGDSGRVITPSEFLSRLSSIREDYPDAAYYSLMNLLDSHDTERLLWTLTPGAETTAEKELDAANVAAGKARVRLASLIQFTVPGAPTVYYGDEIGITGDDDPDDRRTFPAASQAALRDASLLAHYTTLAQLRRDLDVLTDGDFEALLADDANGVAAYGRTTGAQAAVVAINRGAEARTVSIPLAGRLRDGLAFATRLALGVGGSTAGTSSGGALEVTIPANGALLLATGAVDLVPTVAPQLTLLGEGNGTLDVAWGAVPGATSYDVWMSPVTGGGYARQNTAPVTGTSFAVTGLPNAVPAFVVVTATDGAGNVSALSNEVEGLPRLEIGWANLQWPPAMTHTISTADRTDTAYGQVWIDGVTNQPGPAPTLRAQLGFGPTGSNPATSSAWTWVDAEFNDNAGNNDEFKASMLPEAVGAFDYVYRYSVTNGRTWLYADLNGPVARGATPANPGKLTVNASGDTTAPAAPANLTVTAASPAGITLAWDAVADAALYEVQRSATAGGPYTALAKTSTPGYTDTEVVESATYHYVVVAIDGSFNRSAASGEVSGTAALRTVTLVVTVTVPATTDATARSVYIAGFLDRLDGNLPQWNPGGVVLTRVDATHWTITFTGKEATQIEYKYALGSWDYVEKDAGCGEIANRQLTLSYGATGTQVVNDAVLNWRNVAPCGN